MAASSQRDDPFRGAPETRPQWFDVWNVRDFADREELQAEGLCEAAPRVRDMVRDEAARLAGRWDRVVLAGIGMGAATAVHTLFNLRVPAEGGGRLAAFLGFCARCPFVGRDLAGMRAALGLEEEEEEGVDGDVTAQDEVVRRTPVLLEHCVDDPLVKVEKGRGLRDTLRGFGAQVEWKEYPRGGHWFQEPEGLDDAVEFLERVVVESAGASEQGESKATTVASSEAMELS